jgi:hypothetical protein
MAIGIAGCAASGGSVDQDPLTAQMGRSATTLGHAEASFDVSKISQWASAADQLRVKRANALLAHLVAGQFDKVSAAQLDRLIAHPEDMYAASRDGQRRLRLVLQQLRDARIPESSFSSSSDSVRKFVRDFNALVARTGDVYEQTAALLKSGDALKAPTVRFMRSARAAIVARDIRAYRAARDRFVKDLRALPDDGVLGKSAGAGLARATQRADGALETLRKEANASDDVSRLTTAVVHRYPDSVFAKHWGH